jgi:sugar/nucleoside kinase (ribokinase family)
MNLDILTMGPLLVEIIRTEKGLPLGESGYFAGPFPSGDTPIFIDAAAKMGRKCGFVGVVGDDDFGRCATERLSHDGVDISFVRTAPEKVPLSRLLPIFTMDQGNFFITSVMQPRAN